MTSRPGVLDIRDLWHRYMWDERAIAAFVAATGLDPSPVPDHRDFQPPRVLVVVAPFDDPARFEASQPWLRECDEVVVVRDRRGAPIDDPELLSLLLEDWAAVLAPLTTTVFEWTDEDATGCHAALEHARERAVALAPRERALAPPQPDDELPMSLWIPYRSRISYDDAAHVISKSFAFEAGRPPMLLDASGQAHDLAALDAPIELDLRDPHQIAFRAADDPHRVRRHISLDPIHPVAWRGFRMTALVYHKVGRDLCFLSALDHDWPIGPAKKLWGFSNNDPVAIHVTPDADAAALQFTHDVTIIHNVPIGWHRAGAHDVAMCVRDPRRAVLFANDSDWIAGFEPDTEDAREFPPVLVLAPGGYAVDLRHQTYRLGPGHTPIAIGGPDEGYAVFDHDHRCLRRANGRLLGGWYRYATVEDNAALWREDLATGVRTHLGSAARVTSDDAEAAQVLVDAIRAGRDDALPALHAVRVGDRIGAVAIPGTRNVIELTATHLRVI